MISQSGNTIHGDVIRSWVVDGKAVIRRVSSGIDQFHGVEMVDFIFGNFFGEAGMQRFDRTGSIGKNGHIGKEIEVAGREISHEEHDLSVMMSQLYHEMREEEIQWIGR